MRNLILTTAAVAAAIAAAFASEPAHSKNADSSYADYCVNFEESDTTFSVKLLLVKEYRTLEPIRLYTQKSLTCDGEWLSGSERYYFDVVEKRINELSRKFTSSGVRVLFSGWTASYIDGKITLEPETPINHIPKLSVFNVAGHNRDKWKEGLSSLKKNTYTNVRVELWRKCPPLDTTFQADYRVRLIGECK